MNYHQFIIKLSSICHHVITKLAWYSHHIMIIIFPIIRSPNLSWTWPDPVPLFAFYHLFGLRLRDDLQSFVVDELQVCLERGTVTSLTSFDFIWNFEIRSSLDLIRPFFFAVVSLRGQCFDLIWRWGASMSWRCCRRRPLTELWHVMTCYDGISSYDTIW